MGKVYVLGLDPGFASFGYGVVELLRDSERIVEVNVIRTKKDAKKRAVLAADDNFRRARAIYAALIEVVDRYHPVVVAAETMSFPRDASAAAKVAMAWGVISAIAESRQLPMAQASPMKIKQSVAGNPKASKEDVQSALRRRYVGQFFPFQKALPQGQWEHGYDAIGSIVTCLDGDVLRMARGTVNARGE